MRQSVKIIVAGDLCFRNVSDKINHEHSNQILSQIHPILQEADFRVINLENPLTNETTTIPKSGPHLKGAPENICFLEAGQFDCAILANNHMGDYGPKGVTDTLDLLDQKGIGHVGAGRNLDESYRPWYAKKGSIGIALIAVAENEFGGADWDRPGSAGLRLGKLSDTIAQTRQNAEFVIVIVHGGNEYNPLPSPGVVERYRLITKLGADAVIGMHPHCPQGYEIYQDKPIVYSTGNFLFFNEQDQEITSSWYYGYLPVLTYHSGSEIKLDVIPYRFDPDCTRIEPFKNKEHEAMMEYLEKISCLFQDCQRHEDYFKAWCVLYGSKAAKNLVFKESYLLEPDSGQHPDFLAMRNLLTCEAHHEVMATLMRVIENGQISKYADMSDEIHKLQQMPV